MKKIIIFLTLLLIAATANGLLKTAIEIDEPETNEQLIEEETNEYVAGGLDRFLCTGEDNYAGAGVYYYNGDPLTEQAGNCNADVLVRYYEDKNLIFYPDITPPQSIYDFPGLTLPWDMNVGQFVGSSFNWDKPEDYCYTEKFTTRSKTGQTLPWSFSGFDNSWLRVWIFDGDDPDIGPLAVYDYHLVVNNLNKPILSIETDQTNYVIPEGEDMLKVKLTLNDDDLLCGDVNSNEEYLWYDDTYPVDYRTHRADKSVETYEIRVNGVPIDSRDYNSGAFGVYITSGNTGEITLDLNLSDYAPGEFDLNITVLDTDGYHEKTGQLFDIVLLPFVVDEYGTPKQTTIHVTKEGGICADLDNSGRVDVADLVYFVAWAFNGGPAPEILWTADLDGSGRTDVADITYFVKWSFNGGPAPTCGR